MKVMTFLTEKCYYNKFIRSQDLASKPSIQVKLCFELNDHTHFRLINSGAVHTESLAVHCTALQHCPQYSTLIFLQKKLKESKYTLKPLVSFRYAHLHSGIAQALQLRWLTH